MALEAAAKAKQAENDLAEFAKKTERLTEKELARLGEFYDLYDPNPPQTHLASSSQASPLPGQAPVQATQPAPAQQAPQKKPRRSKTQ